MSDEHMSPLERAVEEENYRRLHDAITQLEGEALAEFLTQEEEDNE